MKRFHYTVAVVLVMSVSILPAGVCLGKEESAKAAAPKSGAARKEMSRSELLARLKENLSNFKESLDLVPGLESETAPDGMKKYFYRGEKLDNLSAEDLKSLYGRVGQIAVKVRTDKIQKQLDALRQTQKLQGVATPPQPPRAPSSPRPAVKAPAPAPVPQRRQ